MVINQGEDLLITKEEQKSAGVFGLHPELKIAKEEDGGMDFNGDEKIECENGKARVCEICGKEFSSGKGLGGHMRIHTEPIVSKKKQKPRDDSVKKKDYICSVCGKAFWSLKSVSGHMRCHPERDWRGIQPPSNHTASSSSSSSSSLSDKVKITTVDLTQSLNKWPIKAKRGREGTKGKGMSSEEDDQVLDPVSSEDDDKNVLGAVNELMNLSRTKMLLKLMADHKSSIAVNGEADDDDQMKKKKKLKKRKKMKLCDLKSSDKFKCHTCDKSFPTHQALGGHCSSHNKLSINAKLHGLVEAPSSEETIHMGQAHKTSYESWPSSEETSHKVFAIEMGSQKVFAIDLNEIPPSEDEAGFGSQLACAW